MPVKNCVKFMEIMLQKKKEKNWFAKLHAGNFEIKDTSPLGPYTEIRPNSGSDQVKPTLHDAKHCKNIKD